MHTAGEPTCTVEVATRDSLCRRHHRAKTHSTWRYDILMPGTYLWTSPNGHRFRVDHRGTHPVRTNRTANPPDR